MRVNLQTGWQGGPAWVEIEADELALDSVDDPVGTGVIFTIHTPLDLGGYAAEVELGTMRLELTAPALMARIAVAASEQQARELALVILEMLDGP